MNNAYTEIAHFKKIFGLTTDADLARVCGISAGAINNWKQAGQIPSQTRMLLTYMYRDAQHRKTEILTDTRTYYDECRFVLTAAQKTYGAIPQKEEIAKAAEERFEKQKDKWLKDTGLEQIDNARKQLVIKSVTEGVVTMLQQFLKVNAEGAWPPVSRLRELV